ncbi:MAG: glutamine amidotransferase subunit PdxT [Deltaproteobacteria bacterium CG2_30_63_29]|nr:MAG: glutamine amidotransferase subunit PdxT [Deltaproteobacteria bacterium CG2_30_63_29]PIW00556.1 MAG: pyridoxal 5'-phosphate synthase glutaminase subunit PdxT [Deltaproteobacteria bacterium CG17_big_fil_post_rev_8_21_14_2_50_63_7]
MGSARSRIGVLALQGGYAAHARALEELGHEAVEVRSSEGLQGLEGLILPGGESTTQLKLLGLAEMDAPLDAFVRSGKPVLATCAGAILSAASVRDFDQRSFGWLDVAVARNAWGRQVFSFEAKADEGGPFGAIPLVFIRAPRFVELGARVEVLVTYQGEPVMVRQGNVYAASFHPELSDDRTVHKIVFP